MATFTAGLLRHRGVMLLNGRPAVIPDICKSNICFVQDKNIEI